MSRKIEIESVSNGYICRVIETDLGLFKDPYDKPVSVYTTYDAMLEQLSGFFEGETK